MSSRSSVNAGASGTIAARGRVGEPAAFVRQQGPQEQDEEQSDESDRDTLSDPPRSRGHRYSSTMKTGVPTFTRWNSHSASEMRMRTQPCDAE